MVFWTSSWSSSAPWGWSGPGSPLSTRRRRYLDRSTKRFFRWPPEDSALQVSFAKIGNSVSRSRRFIRTWTGFWYQLLVQELKQEADEIDLLLLGAAESGKYFLCSSTSPSPASSSPTSSSPKSFNPYHYYHLPHPQCPSFTFSPRHEICQKKIHDQIFRP